MALVSYDLSNDTSHYSGDRGNKTRRTSPCGGFPPSVGSLPLVLEEAGKLGGSRIRGSLRLPRGLPRPFRFGGEAETHQAGPHRGDPRPLSGPFKAYASLRSLVN